MTASKDRATRAGNVFVGKRRATREPEAAAIGPAPLDPASLSVEAGAAEAWLDGMVAQAELAPIALVVEITPALARAMFRRNVDNRTLRRNLVTKLRVDIESDRWELNGETIVVARNGELNDGQHRLRAIADSGRTVKSVVVFGVSRESRFTLDLGATRSPADVLHFQGYSHAALLAATSRLVVAFEKSAGKNLAWLRWLSKIETVERATRDEALRDAVHWTGTRYGAVAHLLPTSVLAFLRYMLVRVDPAKADEFLTGLITGADLPVGSPMLSVRRYLYTLSTRNREQAVGMCLRGWVLFAQGQEATAGDIFGSAPYPGFGLDLGTAQPTPADRIEPDNT